MDQNQQPQPNRLDLYRRRMKFTPSEVAHLLGHQNTSHWSDFERGHRLPSLINALSLAIILRVPVEFLFYSLYESLRETIRAEEERMTQPIQQVLF